MNTIPPYAPPPILSLVTPPTLANSVKADVVRILEEALMEAKNGNIESVLLLYKQSTGDWADRRSGSLRFAESIGQLEITKQDWIAHYLSEQICD